MMKKIELKNGVWYLEENNETIGREVGNMKSGRIVLENAVGDQTFATYGTIDEDGQFTAFCQITSAMCGANCVSAGKGSCRYNRNIIERSGYYVDR